MLERLETTDHSLVLSHYWLTRELLAAGFPPLPDPPLLSQPGYSWLPRYVHVDASLSADTGSTWPGDHQGSPPQAILQNLPPSSWITRARHDSRQWNSPELGWWLGLLSQSADSGQLGAETGQPGCRYLFLLSSFILNKTKLLCFYFYQSFFKSIPPILILSTIRVGGW